MRNKVAILGKLETKFKAPFGDKSWEIWTFNKHEEKLPRVDIWFDLHKTKPNIEADIKRENFPVWMLETMLGGRYFNNTVSYLIAYAILKGYKEIALYGMRFDASFEHRRNGEYQNVRELIFFAKGRGIKVTAPFDSVMLEQYKPYGG